jgi:hypothetical protein
VAACSLNQFWFLTQWIKNHVWCALHMPMLVACAHCGRWPRAGNMLVCVGVFAAAARLAGSVLSGAVIMA